MDLDTRLETKPLRPPKGCRNAQDWLRAHESRLVSTEEALSFFDSLPAAGLEGIVGEWRGSGLLTGHPFDGLLESFGWFGKFFVSPENVHPLVFKSDKGDLYSMNSRWVSMELTTRYAKKISAGPLRALFQKSGVALRTQKPTARLRRIEYRGVLSATMIYDYLPINDCFRSIDADTVMGVMDYREIPLPFFFVLRRNSVTSDLYKKLSR